jgi:hypothetical protein
MLINKNYNFEILFDKIEEAKTSAEFCESIRGVDLQVLRDVDEDIKALEEYTNLLQETEFQTYTRS